MINHRDLKDPFTMAMLNSGIPVKQTTAFMGALSNTNKRFYGMFYTSITDSAIITLYQAVIDGNQKQVKRILDSRLDLLLLPVKPDLIIESKLTWQRFFAEDFLMMAVKRKQVNMILLLLFYYKKINRDDLIRNAFDAWFFYETKQINGGERVIIPSEYLCYARSLIYVFAYETFPNGIYGPFSEKTESALSLLFNILFPKQAMKLDDYISIELLLLAMYRVYACHINALSKNQQDAFCIRAIGLVQSALHPESSALLCEGLDNATLLVNAMKRVIPSKRALSHQLKSGENFYRRSRESRSDLGYNYLCSIRGDSILQINHVHNYVLEDFLQQLCLSQIENFQNIKLSINEDNKKQNDNQKHWCCVVS